MFLSLSKFVFLLGAVAGNTRTKRQSPQSGDVQLTCSGESLTVSLNTDQPFSGLLFSQSGGKNCLTRGLGRMETQLEILFRETDVDRCGLERQSDGSYSLVVVVQTHPVIQRLGDKAFQLFCYFDTETKVITNGYDVIPDGVDGVTVISTPSSVLNNTAPAPGVRLRITTGTGEDISGTRLGEKLFLRIEIDRDSIYGIFAKNLKAISPIDEDDIELLDARGCPTDPIIFPGLERLSGRQDLQGSFEAFKFSDTSVVKFQVNVAFCVGGCNPVSCENGIQSFGRRKRDSPTSAMNTRSLVYDQNIGQEVLISNTPLSKEIYVETGTKVDTLKEAGGIGYLGGRDSKAVFILGDDKESELVCTTLPVVITAGAAVIFLQLCILATCILCLLSNRRSKARGGSDGQSLHSGRSSTTPHPTLQTLYHDQLTFRPALPSVTNSRVKENTANTLKSLRTNLRD